MNGQIQYGSARLLTLEATRRVSQSRTADPRRFPIPTSRRLHLAAGGSLLLVALFQTELPRVPALVTLGAAWVSLVLAMTLPTRPELAGHELSRRLAQFRHELTTSGDAADRPTLEHLVARVAALGLTEDDVSEELGQLRASLEALELNARLTRGELPLAETPDWIAAGEVCHFVCPVRHGRRRADQFGHLVMSANSLQFRGALDVCAPWSDVTAVRRDRREIVVVVQETTRVLRFSCHSYEEAARGTAIAEHLTRAAQADVTLGSSEYHVRA